jgi:hypothetical protein
MASDRDLHAEDLRRFHEQIAAFLMASERVTEARMSAAYEQLVDGAIEPDEYARQLAAIRDRLRAVRQGEVLQSTEQAREAAQARRRIELAAAYDSAARAAARVDRAERAHRPRRRWMLALLLIEAAAIVTLAVGSDAGRSALAGIDAVVQSEFAAAVVGVIVSASLVFGLAYTLRRRRANARDLEVVLGTRLSRLVERSSSEFGSILARACASEGVPTRRRRALAAGAFSSLFLVAAAGCSLLLVREVDAADDAAPTSRAPAVAPASARLGDAARVGTKIEQRRDGAAPPRDARSRAVEGRLDSYRRSPSRERD